MEFFAEREVNTGLYRFFFKERVKIFENIDNRTMYRFDDDFYSPDSNFVSSELPKDYFLYFSKYQISCIKNLKIGENCQFEILLYNSADANPDEPPLFAPPLIRISNRTSLTYYTEDYIAEMNK